MNLTSVPANSAPVKSTVLFENCAPPKDVEAFNSSGFDILDLLRAKRE
ncbi:hypothetical protein ACF09I_32350 [Streptomyces sp. NPDC014940]